MMKKIQLYVTGIKYNWKYIQIENKQLIYIINIFLNIALFLFE